MLAGTAVTSLAGKLIDNFALEVHHYPDIAVAFPKTITGRASANTLPSPTLLREANMVSLNVD